MLFFFGLCLYVLTSGAYLDNPDGRSAYSVTRSMVLYHRLSIPASDQQSTMFEKIGTENNIYSKYGIVQPILQIPFFLAAWMIDPTHERNATEAGVSLFAAWITAATLPLFWSIAQKIIISGRVALALTLIYATTTMAWLYATLTYTEPLLTYLLLLTCWILLNTNQHPHQSRQLFLVGLLTGVMILTKYPAIIYVPALLWYAWNICRAHTRSCAAFVFPLVLGIVTFAGYNFIRYQNIFDTGYHILELTRFPRPPWYGFYTLFFSLGKSIFLYAPPLLIALYGYKPFIHQTSSFGTFVIILLCSSVIFYAIVRPWSGAWSPGPRYQLPVLPLALLPLGYILVQWQTLARWKQIIIVTTIALGLFIQIVSVTISYADILYMLQIVTGGKYAWGFWFFDPDYMPTMWQAQLLLSALAKDGLGYTLFPHLNTIHSDVHTGQPIDNINCWVAHIAPYAGWTRCVGWGLTCMLIWLTIQLITMLISPKKVFQGE